MRPLLLMSFLAAALQTPPAFAAPHEDQTQTYVVDTAHSTVGFSVTHIYVERVNGSVPIVSATTTMPSGSLIPTSILATLDPKRIETHDPDRNGVLQGPEWFDVKRFPAWTFQSSTIIPKPENAGFLVNGILTIHGVSQPVTLDATASRAGQTVTVHATGHVDRHAFGMRVTPMDGTIGGDVALSLDIVLRAATELKKP